MGPYRVVPCIAYGKPYRWNAVQVRSPSPLSTLRPDPPVAILIGREHKLLWPVLVLVEHPRQAPTNTWASYPSAREWLFQCHFPSCFRQRIRPQVPPSGFRSHARYSASSNVISRRLPGAEVTRISPASTSPLTARFAWPSLNPAWAITPPMRATGFPVSFTTKPTNKSKVTPVAVAASCARFTTGNGTLGKNKPLAFSSRSSAIASSIGLGALITGIWLSGNLLKSLCCTSLSQLVGRYIYKR